MKYSKEKLEASAIADYLLGELRNIVVKHSDTTRIGSILEATDKEIARYFILEGNEDELESFILDILSSILSREEIAGNEFLEVVKAEDWVKEYLDNL